MKIYMNKKNYKKINNKWILTEDWGTKEISEATYLKFKHEKWSGDRRTFQYNYELGEKVLVKLVNIEPNFKENKNVRVFIFEK